MANHPPDRSFCSEGYHFRWKQFFIFCVMIPLVFLVILGCGDSTQTKDSEKGNTETKEEPQIEARTDKKTEAIPFAVQNEDDPALALGLTSIKQQGVNGVKEITTIVTLTDGKETSRSAPTEKIITAPVVQIVAIGSYVAPPPPPGPISIPDSSCDPNYSGCVPIDSDVDCAGGSGNGPSYVSGPVTVIGSDIYGLDRDGDGVACE